MTSLKTGLAPQYSGSFLGMAHVQTVAGTNTYELFDQGAAPFDLRVMCVHGVMMEAGAPGATIQVRSPGGAITEAIDVSALAANAVFDASTIDVTRWDIARGDKPTVVTTADAMACLVVEFHRR